MSNSTSPYSTSARVLRGIVYILATVLWILALVTISNTFATITSYPYQLDREEGFLLHEAMELRAGRSIYVPIDEYPFTVGNYTPLYPALYAAGLFIVEPSLAVGRSIVLLSTFTLIALMAFLIWLKTRELSAALLAPALFLTTWDLNEWIRYARADLPALAIGFAGFAIVISRTKRWAIVSAAVLFSLAFFTKQTQLVAPAAAFFALLIMRRWKDALLLFAVAAGTSAFFGLLLIWITGGEFWRHTVSYNVNIFEWWQLQVWINHLWFWEKRKLLALLPLAAAAFLLIRGREEEERRTLYSIAIYTALALLSIIQSAKRGSAPNYLLEAQLLIALLLALGIGILLASLTRLEKKWTLNVLALGLILLCLHVAQIGFSRRHFILKPPPPTHQAEDMLALRAMSAPGEIISEEPIYTIMAGKEVLYEPFIMSQLAIEGRWEQDAFLADIRSMRFSLILSLTNFEEDELMAGWTPEMADEIARYYALQEVVQHWDGKRTYVYEPAN